MAAQKSIAVIIVAGGTGERAGGTPKQYRPLSGKPVFTRAVEAFSQRADIKWILPVIHRDHAPLLAKLKLPRDKMLPPVAGGASRQASVLAGLEALAPNKPDLVLIHDAARPLCSPELVSMLVDAAAAGGGAVPGLAVDDLAAVADDGSLVPLVGRHVRIQTPQVFAAKPLLVAYQRAAEVGFEGTDTAACLERFSTLKVTYVPGEEQNFKITYPHDVALADELVRRRDGAAD